MRAWDPWFHQKEIYFSIGLAVVFSHSLKEGLEGDCSATWRMIAADYWCWVHDLQAQQHISKASFISSFASIFYSIHNIKNAEKLSVFLQEVAIFWKHHRHVRGKAKWATATNQAEWVDLWNAVFFLWAFQIGPTSWQNMQRKIYSVSWGCSSAFMMMQGVDTYFMVKQ